MSSYDPVAHIIQSYMHSPIWIFRMYHDLTKYDPPGSKTEAYYTFTSEELAIKFIEEYLKKYQLSVMVGEEIYQPQDFCHLIQEKGKLKICLLNPKNAKLSPKCSFELIKADIHLNPNINQV